jgi:hypothetical protein
MASVRAVSWYLKGEVNEHDFTLSGDGSVDFESGSLELRLTVAPSLPLGYDPGLAHMICNFALAGYAAVPDVPVGMRDAVDRLLHVRPRRQVIITDPAGEQVTRLEALTTLEIGESGISVTNYMTGFSYLPARVATVKGEESLVPGPHGTATGLARYSVVLEDGTVLDGMTVVPYCFDRPGVEVTAARRVIADHTSEWTAPGELCLRSASKWTALPSVDRMASA